MLLPSALLRGEAMSNTQWDALPWLWFSGVLVGYSLLHLLYSGVVVLRAADVHYDAERCAARRPPVDLDKALIRRISWPRIALPLFVICVLLFAIQLMQPTIVTYTVISIGWFLSTPLRKLWGIAIARRVRLRGDTGYWQLVAEYYQLGFSFPPRPEEQTWFVGKYRWLNRFQ